MQDSFQREKKLRRAMQKRVDALTEEIKELRFRLGLEQAADVSYEDWQSRIADLTAQAEQLRLAHRRFEEEADTAHRRSQDEQVGQVRSGQRDIVWVCLMACGGAKESVAADLRRENGALAKQVEQLRATAATLRAQVAAIQSSAVDAVRALSQQQDDEDSLLSVSQSFSLSPSSLRKYRPPDEEGVPERYSNTRQIVPDAATALPPPPPPLVVAAAAAEEGSSLLSASPAIALSSGPPTLTYLSREEEDLLRLALQAIDDREVYTDMSFITYIHSYVHLSACSVRLPTACCRTCSAAT